MIAALVMLGILAATLFLVWLIFREDKKITEQLRRIYVSDEE